MKGLFCKGAPTRGIFAQSCQEAFTVGYPIEDQFPRRYEQPFFCRSDSGLSADPRINASRARVIIGGQDKGYSYIPCTVRESGVTPRFAPCVHYPLSAEVSPPPPPHLYVQQTTPSNGSAASPVARRGSRLYLLSRNQATCRPRAASPVRTHPHPAPVRAL